MASKEQIIHLATSGSKYLHICRKLLNGNSLYKDLYQDFVVELLESDDKRFKDVKCDECFLYGMLSKMVHSSTSRFHYKYRKNITTEIDYDKDIVNESEYDNTIDDKAEKANEIINKLPLHDKKVIDLWINGNSLNKISKKNKVPRYFIKQKVNTITEKIKQELRVQEVEKIKVLLILQTRITALQYHRQLMPHERLTKTNSDILKLEFTYANGKYGDIEHLTDEELSQYKIVYFLRQITFDRELSQKTVERLKRLGIKTIMDIDDYWVLNSEHALKEEYKQKNVAENVIYCLSNVDHVITTTKHLAQKIKEYNQNVTIIPNCINPDAVQFDNRNISSPRLRFGWVGGVFHRPDIEILKDNFKKIYSDNQMFNSVQVSVGGFSCNTEYKEIEKTFTANYSFRNSDATYYKYLMQCTPTMEHIAFDKVYKRLWGRDIFTYGELYNEVDVALIPLKENEFNKCKSELKIVEAGWMKKAVICSTVSPYKEWIEHNKNGLLVSPSRNNIDWYIAMKRCMNNPNLVSDMGEALHETIKENFDMDKHNKTRVELYKSLI